MWTEGCSLGQAEGDSDFYAGLGSISDAARCWVRILIGQKEIDPLLYQGELLLCYTEAGFNSHDIPA